MIMGNRDGLAAEMAALQKKLASLKLRSKNSGGGKKLHFVAKIEKRKVKRPAPGRQSPKTQHRIGHVTIAPGITLTTLPGSMYSAMAQALATAGSLDRHDEFFNEFLRKPNASAALELLKKIGLSRDELEMLVRANQQFREHCDDRTRQMKKALATGTAKAKAKAHGILKNPKICDAHGRWIGDLDEGVSILSGARTLKQVRKGKNLRILNKAKLMFDTLEIEGIQLCFLYKQKWHRAFLRAVALVNP